MKNLIKNFFYGLRRSISQAAGLVVALVVMISLFTGFWLSSVYGYNQVKIIEGDYLDSMLSDYHQIDLNDHLWKNVSYKGDDGNAVDDYFDRLSSIMIFHQYDQEDRIIPDHYVADFYDGNKAWLGEPSTVVHNSNKYVFNFKNPFANYHDDINYIDFDVLANYCENGALSKDSQHRPLHLLPNAFNQDKTKTMYQLFSESKGNKLVDIALDHWKSTLFLANSNEDNRPADKASMFLQANLFSKKLLWEIVLGINGDDFKIDDHFSYEDPINQLSWIVFPQHYNLQDIYYSNPVFSGNTSQLALLDDEVLLSKNFANTNNFIHDSKISLAGNKYTIKGNAVNAIYNSNLNGVDFKYVAGVWTSLKTYQNQLDSDKYLSGFTHSQNVYFKSLDMKITNPQLFLPDMIDQNADPTGDIYYANRLLTLFLRNVPASLPNYFYKIPMPTTDDDEMMGIHEQLKDINKRNDLLFDILLVTAAILEVACVVMVIVVVSSLIKSNRQSLGVIKANGLSSWRIAIAVCFCFAILLLITGLLTIIVSVLIGYILDLTYVSFTEMTSYTVSFIWYIAIVDFFLPLLLVIPIVLLCAYWQTSKSPLLLIKGAGEKQRIKLINFKMRYDPFKWIKKINLSFKSKLSLKFAFDAKGKLFLVLLISLIAVIMIYTSLNLFFTNHLMLNNINTQLKADAVYGYDSQNVEKANERNANKYSFLDQSEFNPNLIEQELFNPFNGKKEMITHINGIGDVSKLTSLRNTWMYASLLVKNWNNLPQHIKDILKPNKEMLKILANNNGIFTIGFEMYNPYQEQLFANRTIGIYELAGKKAASISVFSHKTDDWFNRAVFNKLYKNQALLVNKGANVVATDRYENSKSYLQLKLAHFDVTNFLAANVNPAVDLTNLNDIKLDSQLQMAQNQQTIVSSLDLLAKKLIPEWVDKMKIAKINVIPIAVNKFYYISGRSKIGDILYSNLTNEGTLNVYVIYDWSETMNYSFMVAPYKCVVNGLMLDAKPKVAVKNHYYNWKLSVDPKPVYVKQISIVSKTGNYDMPKSEGAIDAAFNNDYHINLNYILNKNILIDTLLATNNSIIAIMWVIGVLTFLMSIIQIIVTLNIILRSNINTINLLKSFGYTKRWIAMRIFIIYLPLIIVAGLLAFPFGYLVSYYGWVQLVLTSGMFVSYIVDFSQIVYITLVIIALFIALLILMSWINAKRYPVYQFLN